MTYAKSLPVLIYHNIGSYASGLFMPPALFAQHCRILAENGWRGISLAEAEDFFINGVSLPAKSCLVTMDDGYLDNYVYAWPILRKYGHKGVIFAVSDMLSEAGKHAGMLRPTLADVWSGEAKESDIADSPPMRDTGLGYLTRKDTFITWAEARAMEASGVISVAAHTLRHEAVFTGPAYNDFIRPHPEEYAFNRAVKGAPYGLPLFTRGAETTNRAFLPAPELMCAVTALVPQDEAGAFEFFQDQSRVKKLQDLADSFEVLGRLETPEEMEERVNGLFRANSAALFKELGHAVRSLCWPWGAYNEYALSAARKAGFEVFFKVAPGPNPPGHPLRVNRFNAKKNAEKTLKRLRIYSRPVLGALYAKVR